MGRQGEADQSSPKKPCAQPRSAAVAEILLHEVLEHLVDAGRLDVLHAERSQLVQRNLQRMAVEGHGAHGDDAVHYSPPRTFDGSAAPRPRTAVRSIRRTIERRCDGYFGPNRFGRNMMSSGTYVIRNSTNISTSRNGTMLRLI